MPFFLLPYCIIDVVPHDVLNPKQLNIVADIHRSTHSPSDRQWSAADLTIAAGHEGQHGGLSATSCSPTATVNRCQQTICCHT